MRSTTREGSTLLHRHLFDDPNVSLRLTNAPWSVEDKQATEILGLDVITDRGMRPDRGRRPIAGLIPTEDLPLVWSYPLESDVLVPVRVSALHKPQGLTDVFALASAGGTSYDTSAGTLTQVALFTNYPWREGDIALLYRDDDGFRLAAPIIGFTDFDEIKLEPGLTTGDEGDLGVVILHGRQIVSLTVSGSTWLIMSPLLYAETGGWSDELVNSLVFFNNDRRLATSRTLGVKSIESFGQTNNALRLNGTFSPGDDGKVSVVGSVRVNRRGILLSNGRKFWMQQGGEVTLLMDLNSDDFLGVKWRIARIATNRLLLVHPDYAPRVLHFNRADVVADDDALAGCIPPQKPASIELLTDTDRRNASWLMYPTSGGSLNAGTIQALVRGVNLEDGIYSAMVPVTHGGSLSNNPTVAGGTSPNLKKLTVTATQRVSVYTAINSEDDKSGASDATGFTPPIHKRITHIEVWRTQAGASSAFYLESRMVIADPIPGNELMTSSAGTVKGRGWFAQTPPGTFPITLADTDVLGLVQLSDSERFSGGLPPVCKDVVSLFDTTVCFGRASNLPEIPVAYARNIFTTTASYDPTTGLVTFDGGITTSEYDTYVFQEGDQLVVSYHSKEVDEVSDALPPGVYDITAFSAGTVTIATGLTPAAEGTQTDIHCHIRRPYPVQYPVIESDEDVWYSRTDLFAPENFPARVLRLSRSGDTFRKAVVVDPYVVVVMAQGVHLLYKSGTELLKETIAENGMGTPWEDSVVVAGKVVFWADSQGIQALSMSAQGDDMGNRGKINRVNGLAFESWFQEAVLNGETIDAGYDSFNGCLRFRRSSGQVLQGSLRTGRWTLLDDDRGVNYVSSAYAEEVPVLDALLYSTEAETGRLFNVNNQQDSHPYDGYTVQAVLQDYNTSPTKIQSLISEFTPFMAGDVIRFRIPGQDDEVRTILTATDKVITFSAVYDIQSRDEFLIGSNRFRIRFAPLHGDHRNSSKRIHDIQLRAFPGSRDSAEQITLRGISDYDETTRLAETVNVFKTGQTSQSRVGSLAIEGTALEIELENLETRNDFFMESLLVEVREESPGGVQT